jgi:hypothetical protein
LLAFFIGAIGSILIKAGRLKPITNHEGLLLVPGKNSIWRPHFSASLLRALYDGLFGDFIDLTAAVVCRGIGRLLCRARPRSPMSIWRMTGGTRK